MSRRPGLGRGLEALIPVADPGAPRLIHIRPSEIARNPRQPRGEFDAAAIEELAESMRQVGVLQPVLVRPRADGTYELIAGERRTRAAELAGIEDLPAIVRDADDTSLLTEALVENIHRTDLNPLEEAAAFEQLLDDFGFTHDELAARLGKSRPAITNSLRLLNLGPIVQAYVARGSLRAGHARALLPIQSPELQAQIAERVVEEELSVRATEELVREAVAADPVEDEPPPPASRGGGPRPLAHIEERLSDVLATKVAVQGTATRGRLLIDFAGREDLERLLSILSRGTGHSVTEEER